jgi:hypothetical protein
MQACHAARPPLLTKGPGRAVACVLEAEQAL